MGGCLALASHMCWGSAGRHHVCTSVTGSVLELHSHPGQRVLQDKVREFFPEARQADGYRHLLVGESLFRTSHPACAVGGLVPMRTTPSLEGRCQYQSGDLESAGLVLSLCDKCPHLFGPWFLHQSKTAWLSGLLWRSNENASCWRPGGLWDWGCRVHSSTRSVGGPALQLHTLLPVDVKGGGLLISCTALWGRRPWALGMDRDGIWGGLAGHRAAPRTVGLQEEGAPI